MQYVHPTAYTVKRFRTRKSKLSFHQFEVCQDVLEQIHKQQNTKKHQNQTHTNQQKSPSKVVNIPVFGRTTYITPSKRIMSTLASALSVAGTRTSGAPVRTQNGNCPNANPLGLQRSSLGFCVLFRPYISIFVGYCTRCFPVTCTAKEWDLN